jgi:hypothetical protein
MDPGNERVEHRQSQLRVLLEQRPELPGGDQQARQLIVGNDGGRAVVLLDQRQLAEEVAGPDPRHHALVGPLDPSVTLRHDVQVERGIALPDHDLVRGKRPPLRVLEHGGANLGCQHGQQRNRRRALRIHGSSLAPSWVRSSLRRV